MQFTLLTLGFSLAILPDFLSDFSSYPSGSFLVTFRIHSYTLSALIRHPPHIFSSVSGLSDNFWLSFSGFSGSYSSYHSFPFHISAHLVHAILRNPDRKDSN
ncbi:hypothetical protein GGU11DRAFT_593270 [Lentinula aff. detonsa]|nr:hypothetical protein GGU11DRAFT_593270 [Lentinula aff. detonsa]